MVKSIVNSTDALQGSLREARKFQHGEAAGAGGRLRAPPRLGALTRRHAPRQAWPGHTFDQSSCLSQAQDGRKLLAPQSLTAPR